MSASPRSSSRRTAAGASPTAKVAQSYRMNVGTIVEADMLKVRLVQGKAPEAGECLYRPLRRGGRVLGEIEEYFLETLAPNDTFLLRRRDAGAARHRRG